jgi:hypothetical protein
MTLKTFEPMERMERASFPQLGELQLEEMEMRTVGVEEALAPLLRHIRYGKKGAAT